MVRPKRDSLSYLNTVAPVPIQLTDGDNSQFTELSRITDVLVGDHHEISGDSAGLYVVWSIRIVLNDAPYSLIVLYKRYSDIERFRAKLVKQYPNNDIPPLPPKDNFSMMRMWLLELWLDTRRKGLQWFMSYVMLNPQYQHSPLITEFVLSNDNAL